MHNELSASRLKGLLASLVGRRVLVVGDLMLDRYVWGRVERISPEAPVPVVEVERESSLAGGAANVARTIAALGGVPLLLGVVGADEAADELSACRGARGVAVAYHAAVVVHTYEAARGVVCGHRARGEAFAYHAAIIMPNQTARPVAGVGYGCLRIGLGYRAKSVVADQATNSKTVTRHTARCIAGGDRSFVLADQTADICSAGDPARRVTTGYHRGC